jgi:hypothetical protein
MIREIYDIVFMKNNLYLVKGHLLYAFMLDVKIFY